MYFVYKRLYLKNELGDPHFLLLKVISRLRRNSLQSFKKSL